MAYAPSDLLLDLITLLEKPWVIMQDLQVLSDKLGFKTAPQNIAFLREIKRLIRLLPPESFIHEEQRQNLLTVCQNALDAAIVHEEETLSHGSNR